MLSREAVSDPQRTLNLISTVDFFDEISLLHLTSGKMLFLFSRFHGIACGLPAIKSILE